MDREKRPWPYENYRSGEITIQTSTYDKLIKSYHATHGPSEPIVNVVKAKQTPPSVICSRRNICDTAQPYMLYPWRDVVNFRLFGPLYIEPGKELVLDFEKRVKKLFDTSKDILVAGSVAKMDFSHVHLISGGLQYNLSKDVNRFVVSKSEYAVTLRDKENSDQRYEVYGVVSIEFSLYFRQIGAYLDDDGHIKFTQQADVPRGIPSLVYEGIPMDGQRIDDTTLLHYYQHLCALGDVVLERYKTHGRKGFITRHHRKYWALIKEDVNDYIRLKIKGSSRTLFRFVVHRAHPYNNIEIKFWKYIRLRTCTFRILSISEKP